MSDAVPVSIPASLVQGTQAPAPAAVVATSRTLLPQGGISPAQPAITARSPGAGTNPQAQSATPVAPKPAATHEAFVPALVQQLNKYLNDSGRAIQFRIDPTSRDRTIQEINPSNGEVIGEFSASEFPALVRSLGVSGVLVNSRA
jgi:uncharacterized FlaG/YvyC family protein